MTFKAMLAVLVNLVVILLQVNAQGVPVFEDSSQVPEINTKDIVCESYNTTGFCQQYLGVLGSQVKYARNTSRAANISEYDESAARLHGLLLHRLPTHQKCLDIIIPFLCRWVFSSCDPAYNIPVRQRVCFQSCQRLSTFECGEVWDIVLQQIAILDFGILDAPMCSILSPSNGGDAPDCIDGIAGGEIPEFSQTADCFSGQGRGYNGTMSTTISEKTCQAWNVQAPHQFILPSIQYPEIAGGHNYCRNPGSRAPNGPWCFTTDPDTRWEYCDVQKCDPAPTCEFYVGSVCYGMGAIGNDYVYVNNSDTSQQDLDSRLMRLNSTLQTKMSLDIPHYCDDMILTLMCHNSFQLCDHNSTTPVPRRMCRSYCEAVSTGECRPLWDGLNLASVLAVIQLPDCSTLPSPEAGDSLECFIPYNTGRRPNNQSECYLPDDKGVNYNGTVNVTVSEKLCQKWDLTTPHFHPLTSRYRPYLEGHNYCRNPEGRGIRPWCYTTDPSTRWEYCDVQQCSTRTPSGGDDSNDDSTIIIAIIVPILFVIAVLLTIIVLVIVYRIFLYKRNESKGVKLENGSPARKGSIPNDYTGGTSLTPLDATIKIGDFKLPHYSRANITYISDLGQGNFGMVLKGQAKEIIPGQSSTIVAIKVLKEGSNTNAKNDFLHEASFTNQFDHPNILKLLGVCLEEEPFCMIFEYMELGDLNSYLRSKAVSVSQPSAILSIQQTVNMAVDIASGLEYLASCHFVHRDLATRNCLIDSQLHVKIADFGLSKDVYSKDYYRLGEKSLLPIRWMPPEAIVFSKFTTQSDMWSFGIVLWELFSSGAQPYYTLSNEEVVDYVTNEKVLRCPVDCPSELYDLMLDCWATIPEDRPTASDVREGLQNWSPELSAQNAADHLQYVQMNAAKDAVPKVNGTLSQSKETMV